MASSIVCSSNTALFCSVVQSRTHGRQTSLAPSLAFSGCTFSRGALRAPRPPAAATRRAANSEQRRGRLARESTRGRRGARGAAVAKLDDIETEVVIVGAGLAGLAAARALARASVPFVLLEASDGVGGRVRTDAVDGYLLDRGFQIFLTAYPECKKELDYAALDLKPFYSGALVRHAGAFHRVADPFRHLADSLGTLANPVGSVLDKLRVGILRLRTLSKSLEAIQAAPETSIEARLRQEGFSDSMIDRFFRPFLGGIFFDRELTTTSRMLELVLQMLALGANTVPAGGIGAIPAQLAASLPQGSVRLETAVNRVEVGADALSSSAKATVSLSSGQRISAKRGVIVAVGGPEGSRLLGGLMDASPSKGGEPRKTVCLYFAADEAPNKEPILFLNGTDGGIVNNMCFPSSVAPSYAPPGKVLVSVSLIGPHADRSDAQLEGAVREELSAWFGRTAVDTWRHLRTYRISFAQPDQRPPTNLRRPVKLQEGVYVCGDHRDSATFHGAMLSGRRAAESLLQDTAKIKERAVAVEA